MLWSKELLIEFIDMLRAAPALWAKHTKEYRDRNLKHKELNKIASRLKTNVKNVSKKIKLLKIKFRDERKKIADMEKSGAAYDGSIWFGYRMLSFLAENDISRGSGSTIEVNAANATSQDDAEHSEKLESQNEGCPSNANKPSTSSPIKPSSEVKNKLKRKINDDARVVEAYKCKQSIKENVNTKNDFAVYGENVASRIRCANQSVRAIAIAKNRIDNILFQLEMGEFAMTEEKTPDPKSHLNQFPINPKNYKYHPDMNYSQAASPTPSLLSMSLCTSTPSPYSSPSSTQSQPMHSFLIPKDHYGSPPLFPPHTNFTETHVERPWQPQTFNTLETQQPQSQMYLPRKDCNVPPPNEFLDMKSNSLL